MNTDIDTEACGSSKPGIINSEIAHIKGMTLENGVKILEAPYWNSRESRWEALAQIGDSLCFVELKITLKT